MSASQIRPTRRTGDLARARRELERAEATMLAQQEICERLSESIAFEGDLDRDRTYVQGMTQRQKDRADGHRDALRVLAGMQPLERGIVSAAYLDGWTLAASEAAGGAA